VGTGGFDVGDGDNARPPRPRLALRVGITGQRAEQLDDMAETAAMDIVGVLAALRGAVIRLAGAEKELFASEPPLLRCISALASGTDQLAARAALELEYRLSAPLPFVRNDYFQDFTSASEEAAFDYLIARCDSVFELDGSRARETAAYEAAGLTVLRQSDVLLAVWDGEEARGRGGTAEIVRAALESAIPVIWIKPGESGARLIDHHDADILDDSAALHRLAPLADEEQLGRLVRDQFVAAGLSVTVVGALAARGRGLRVAVRRELAGGGARSALARALECVEFVVADAGGFVAERHVSSCGRRASRRSSRRPG
jgi:hypothetical protein